VLGERFPRRRQPTGNHLTVTIDELHESQLRPQHEQLCETEIAGPGGSERFIAVQLDHVSTHLTSPHYALIGGAGVHVDDQRVTGVTGVQRCEASLQTLAFVTPDHHDACIFHGSRSIHGSSSSTGSLSHASGGRFASR
jgi:hypothetical protein